MWPRTVEVMLAAWLAVSPFVFRYPDDEPALWLHDFIAAGLLAALALTSFVRQTGRAHLLELLVAVWLIGHGWATAQSVYDAPRQNWMCLGLLLLMTAIIPSRCAEPPARWQAWNGRHGRPARVPPGETA